MKAVQHASAAKAGLASGANTAGAARASEVAQHCQLTFASSTQAAKAKGGRSVAPRSGKAQGSTALKALEPPLDSRRSGSPPEEGSAAWRRVKGWQYGRLHPEWQHSGDDVPTAPTVTSAARGMWRRQSRTRTPGHSAALQTKQLQNLLLGAATVSADVDWDVEDVAQDGCEVHREGAAALAKHSPGQDDEAFDSSECATMLKSSTLSLCMFLVNHQPCAKLHTVDQLWVIGSFHIVSGFASVVVAGWPSQRSHTKRSVFALITHAKALPCVLQAPWQTLQHAPWQAWKQTIGSW